MLAPARVTGLANTGLIDERLKSARLVNRHRNCTEQHAAACGFSSRDAGFAPILASVRWSGVAAPPRHTDCHGHFPALFPCLLHRIIVRCFVAVAEYSAKAML